MTALGVMFRREWPASSLVDVARRVEVAGLDELWVVEDLGYHGGVAQSAIALGATDRIVVGLGIAPAVVRNAAYLAMEAATLAHAFPGRFHLGLGHGVAGWIEQVGATPTSSLAALRETTQCVVRLLRGEPTSLDGRHVRLRDVVLVDAPASPPPVSLGVRGPRSLEVVRDHADGVILPEWSSPADVRAVRDAVGPGRRLTVLVVASADDDGLRAALHEALPEGDAEQLGTLALRTSRAGWLDGAGAWAAAGADAVVLTPLASDPPAVLDRLLDAAADSR